jgi:uncharacterized RDD family membrane protein YckC
MNQGTVNPYAAPGADLDVGLAADTQTSAGRGARLAAAILNGLVLLMPPILIVVLAGIGKGPGEQASPVGVGLALLAVLGIVVYQSVGLATKGQSLGKKWLGIKIVRLDGGPVSFGSAVVMRVFVPLLLGIVPGFGLVDTLFIFRDDRRCIHDLIAATKVVLA